MPATKSAIVLGLACSLMALARQPATEVKTHEGSVGGAVADGIVSFKGIPFAQPPTADNRWRPPQSLQPWTGVRDATEYASDCMQLPFPSDAAPLGTKPAE